MNCICSLVTSPEHQSPNHPEIPSRFQFFDQLRLAPYSNQITWVETIPAEPIEIAQVHEPSMVDAVQIAANQGPMIIDLAPTYVTQGSFLAALNAAGGVLTCSRMILQGKAQRAFALVRPPGHHAKPDWVMGFCLFNNLAIAVHDALQMGVEKVMIVDFDAHHGNGTQDIFANEKRVTFISTHQEHIYPGTGMFDNEPIHKGRIINLPLPANAGDRAFSQIAEHILVPVANRLKPEIIFVSAGFDAHWTDPITQLGVSTTGFYQLSQILIQIADTHCNGRIIYVLEGGYNPKALFENVSAALSAMTGNSNIPDSYGPSPHSEPDISSRIERIRENHRIR